MPSAEVWIDTIPRRSTTTDADGAFAFDRLVGRTFTVGAKSGELIGGPQSLRLSERSEATVIRLREGAHVDVFVTDAEKTPLADVDLRVVKDGTIASTDKQGAARLTATPGWIEIEATAAGYAPSRFTTIVGSAGATRRAIIVLHRGFAVTGRVVDEHGKAIANARIFALAFGAQLDEGAKEAAITDELGAFRIEALAGSHSFLAIDSEHAPSKTSDIDVDRAMTGVEIAMKPGAVYAGSVVDIHGKPVPSASVRLHPRSWDLSRETTTDSNGAFEVRGLPRTWHVAYAESDVGVSREAVVDLTAGEQRDQKFVLEHVRDTDGTISGSVVDDTGAPIADVTVNAKMRQRETTVMSSSSTDHGGKFSVAELPRGEYFLWIGRSDREPRVDDETVARTGQHDVRITRSRLGAIKGKVVVAATAAPARSFIVTPEAGERWPIPGENGDFEIRDVTAGSYTLTFTGPEFVETTRPNVNVEPGKTTDLGTLVVQSGRTVGGIVVDAAGNPIAGATVILGHGGMFGDRNFDGELVGFRSATSDDQGAFSIVGVSATTARGPVQLSAVADHPLHGRSAPVEIQAGAGDPSSTRLVLRGYGSIAGRVTQNGQPVSNALVGAGWPEMGMATTAEDGAFTISRLPGGPVVLRTMLVTEMLRPNLTNVDVVAGKQTNVSIEIPVGAMTLLVNVTAEAGAQVPAASVFLFTGTVTIATYDQVARQLWLSSRGTAAWLGDTSPPPRFDALVPGDYTVCTIPLAGAPNDDAFMQRVRANGDKVRAYCVPVHVAASPGEQSVGVRVPAMAPLPMPAK